MMSGSEFDKKYGNCSKCGKLIPICQEMCRSCSLNEFGIVLTPNEKGRFIWRREKSFGIKIGELEEDENN